MSRLEQLIAELCPNGVGFERLGNIAKRNHGTNITANQMKALHKNNAPVRIFAGGSTIADVNYNDIPQKDIITQTSIIVKSRGYIGFEYYERPFSHKNEFWSYTFKENVNTKFVYYYLLTKAKDLQDTAKATSVKIPQLSVADTDKLLIPLPPLPVQAEIVRILDKFTVLETKLEAELAAEMEARKKQYEYYRNSLLNFSGSQTASRRTSVRWLTLGELAISMFRGTGIKREQVSETGTPCVRYGEIYTTYNIWFDTCASHTDEGKISGKKYFEYGDILFAITGESVDEIAKSCAYVGNEKCLAGGDIVVMKHKQNPKYLAYALSTTDAQKQKSKGRVKSKVVHSSIPALKEIKVPVPPLEEQERIVAILDRFDALVNDITQGLPAEIAARRRQYEYYRDRLLTFEEVVAG